MNTDTLLEKAVEHAQVFLRELDSEPVASDVDAATMRDVMVKKLTEEGVPAELEVDELVRDVEQGILRSGSGRFFGWVIGWVLPVTLAADWLTATWDLNAAIFATSLAAATATAEEVAGEWLKDILGLPATASVGFLTGTQAAHTVAMAAARNKLLAEAGWDTNQKGLMGAPAIRVLTGQHRHESILRCQETRGLGACGRCLRLVGGSQRSV